MNNIPDLEMMMVEKMERLNERVIKIHFTNGQTYAFVIDEYANKDGRPVLEIVKEK